MMLRIIAAALVAAAPLIASAEDCPTATDLENGIIFSHEGSDETVTIRAVGDVVELKYQFANASDDDMAFNEEFDHPLVNRRNLGNGEHPISVSYTSDVMQLDQLHENNIWVSEYEYLQNGQTVNSGVLVIKLVEVMETAIGGCLYESWFVETITVRPHQKTLSRDMIYLPSLKAVIAATSVDESFNKTDLVYFFDQITAE